MKWFIILGVIAVTTIISIAIGVTQSQKLQKIQIEPFLLTTPDEKLDITTDYLEETTPLLTTTSKPKICNFEDKISPKIIDQQSDGIMKAMAVMPNGTLVKVIRWVK